MSDNEKTETTPTEDKVEEKTEEASRGDDEVAAVSEEKKEMPDEDTECSLVIDESVGQENEDPVAEDTKKDDRNEGATDIKQDSEEVKEEDDDKIKDTKSDVTSDDGDEDEKEFEPTIDMMINDFDDERTLEEEEAMETENSEDAAAEAEALEEEADMPLEELLKKYGVGAPPSGADTEEGAVEDEMEEEQEEGDEEEEEEVDKESEEKKEITVRGEKRPLEESPSQETSSSKSQQSQEESSSSAPKGSMSPPPPAKKCKSELARFYEATVEGRSLRSAAIGAEEEDEEDSGKDGVGQEGESDLDDTRDYSWKKTIMIGPSYQASVPNDLSPYDDTPPYQNEDKLLWDPKGLGNSDVEEYLMKAQEVLHGGGGLTSLPLGAHVRDDEQALYQLHQCGNNVEEALRRRRMNATPVAETMSLWSEEECRAFELGLRLYGKDFHMIQQQKVRTRSVGELVQFYYLWKKTERHDVFVNATRLEKKKYILHPGTTDYMDRFIDEQDPSRDLSASSYHSLFFGLEKRSQNNLNPSINNVIQNNKSDENKPEEKLSNGNSEVKASELPSENQSKDSTKA